MRWRKSTADRDIERGSVDLAAFIGVVRGVYSNGRDGVLPVHSSGFFPMNHVVASSLLYGIPSDAKDPLTTGASRKPSEERVMRTYLSWMGLSALALMFACSSQSPKDNFESGDDEIMTVRGTLTTAASKETRVIAVTDDNTQRWAYLKDNGDFTLKLPVGPSYRLIFADPLAQGGQVKIGQLMIETSSGESEWIGANESGRLDLGDIGAGVEAGGVTTQTILDIFGGKGGKGGKGGSGTSTPDAGTPQPPPPDDDGGDDEGDEGDEGDKDGKGGSPDSVCRSDEREVWKLKPAYEPGSRWEDANSNSHPKTTRDDDQPCKLGKGGDLK
jgi:hypothetical protein